MSRPEISEKPQRVNLLSFPTYLDELGLLKFKILVFICKEMFSLKPYKLYKNIMRF